MRQTIGLALQFCCLVFLPLLVIFDLNFQKFPLIVMPACLVVAIVLFTVGHRLRSS